MFNCYWPGIFLRQRLPVHAHAQAHTQTHTVVEDEREGAVKDPSLERRSAGSAPADSKTRTLTYGSGFRSRIYETAMIDVKTEKIFF